MKTNSPASTAVPTLPANDIRGVKPPIDIPNFWLWIWAGIGLLILILVAYLVWRALRKKGAQPPPIPIFYPHRRAREQLEKALALIGEPQPFCIFVSNTIRTYLEQRFKFHAPDRTTEEFLHELQVSPLLLPDQKQSLSEFLSVCDMVKFARYEPGLPELQALHQSAVRLIDETEPADAPSADSLVTEKPS